MPSVAAVASPMSRVSLVHTARVAGAFYLALAITGMLGFLVVRPALFVAGDPASTRMNLIEHETLARAGIALEMGIVLAQALAAMWFFRLFRSVDDFAAGSIAVSGLVNAIAVLASTSLLATALQSALAPGGVSASDPQLLYLASTNFWQVGNLFFGLWLIPMGWCVLRSRWMPRALGWVLVVGGAAYVLNAFAGYLAPDAAALLAVLPLPAMVGEFWMIGYLLARGVSRDQAHGVAPRDAPR